MATRNGFVSCGMVYAIYLPGRTRRVVDVFEEEGVQNGAQVQSRIGIRRIYTCDGQLPTELAAAAARAAMERANLQPDDIDVVCDFTTLPEDYLVPAWSGANKVQNDIAARNAFTTGFSGGGATNIQIALRFARALIESDELIRTALLISGERAIKGHRVVDPDQPLTVCSDGASAVIVRRGITRNVILDSELWSIGALHSVCCVPGGAMKHPTDYDLYRLRFDRAKYESMVRPIKMGTMRRMIDGLLGRAGLRMADIKYFVYPNISAEDQCKFMEAFGLGEDRICTENLPSHGYLQSTDAILNHEYALERGLVREGDHVLWCSHGLGLSWGVTLIRC